MEAPKIFLQGITVDELRQIIREETVPSAAKAAELENVNSDLLTSEEVRMMLKCSNATLIRYRKDKKLPFTKIGNKVFHSRAAVLKAFGSAA